MIRPSHVGGKGHTQTAPHTGTHSTTAGGAMPGATSSTGNTVYDNPLFANEGLHSSRMMVSV
jgi:hypothetical protein